MLSMWCSLRAGKSYFFKLGDVRGAFTKVTLESVQQHLEATQRPPEAAIHHNQHLNTVLRTRISLFYSEFTHTTQEVRERPSA